MCEINHRPKVVSFFLICHRDISLKCLQIKVTGWFISNGEEMCSEAEYPLQTLIISLRKEEKHVSVSAG